MSKDDVKYVCSECGYSSSKWMGKCPSCGSWNSFTEKKEEEIKREKGLSKEGLQSSSVLLSKVPYETDFRYESGLSELDRVLGGGIVKASSVLIGGEPGIGKSTLLIQVAHNCSFSRKVLYISGEESAGQIRQRAERLNLNLERINILCETKLEVILDVILKEKPQVVIADSLQTMASVEMSSQAGSITQIRYCCMEISNLCKANGIAVFFVAHVTKEGTIAGPKIIEHMVDTVIYFEQETVGVRLIRSVKNRFGSVDEIGIFQMTDKGLVPVSDPAMFFISEREGNSLPPGIAYSAVVEGSRTFIVEIQALVVEAKTGYSRIYSEKIESSRVSRIAAIMEKHANVRLTDKDIYVNVGGGIKVDDVCTDLAIAEALWSALTNESLPNKTLYIGELSLAGEVRPVSYLEKRLKAAFEMGFSNAVTSDLDKIDLAMNIKRCRQIKDAIME